jgi:Uma2 family endonuclease
VEVTALEQEAIRPATQTQLTAHELAQLPNDGRRYELVRGELRVMTPAGFRHGRIANTIAYLLTQHVRQHSLGVVCAAETGFRLQEDPDTVRAADAAFVAQTRIPSEEELEGYVSIAPDLVVEVVSPSDAAPEVHSKAIDWLTAGCRLVWVVYPGAQTVTEYRSLQEVQILTAEGTLDGGDVLPGFRHPVREIFE